MIHKLALAIAIASSALLGATFVAQAQTKKGAWCEENCRQLCRLTFRDLEACAKWNKCASYRGKECASDARVKARARSYCAVNANQCP